MKSQADLRADGQRVMRLDEHASQAHISRKGQRHAFPAVNLRRQRGTRMLAPICHLVVDQAQNEMEVLLAELSELNAAAFARERVTDLAFGFNEGQVFGRTEAKDDFGVGGKDRGRKQEKPATSQRGCPAARRLVAHGVFNTELGRHTRESSLVISDQVGAAPVRGDRIRPDCSTNRCSDDARRGGARGKFPGGFSRCGRSRHGGGVRCDSEHPPTNGRWTCRALAQAERVG